MRLMGDQSKGLIFQLEVCYPIIGTSQSLEGWRKGNIVIQKGRVNILLLLLQKPYIKYSKTSQQ